MKQGREVRQSAPPLSSIPFIFPDIVFAVLPNQAQPGKTGLADLFP